MHPHVQIACVYISAHVKDPIVLVRLRWTKTPSMDRRLSSVTVTAGFPRGRQPKFPMGVCWCFKPSQSQRIILGLRETFTKRYVVERTPMEKSHWDNAVVKSKASKVSSFVYLYALTKQKQKPVRPSGYICWTACLFLWPWLYIVLVYWLVCLVWWAGTRGIFFSVHCRALIVGFCIVASW